MALARAGFREYEIEGVHEPAWRPSEYLYLRWREGRWVVGLCERGVYIPMRRFIDEEQACRSFYDLVISSRPPPPPGERPTDEELGRSQDIAWEEYRRARDAQGNGESRPHEN
ncbi:hypothetical protein [Actinomadura madurae]|uniref:hypothetical protein n=1 Tax=Actinomadura madurae TaxID=1993 RepID=UPI0020D2345F|nr:hypothetical protein [Actinomadura madurae]MCP9978607.1 hypothetical protein [Actinomadura madurae]MCQ0009868.1 hypothetical protein [Actinomadura madurae]